MTEKRTKKDRANDSRPQQSHAGNSESASTENGDSWYSPIVNVASGGMRYVVDLARLVLTGKATAIQVTFFAVGALAIIAIVGFCVLAILQGDPYLLLWMFLGFVVVVLGLIFGPTVSKRDREGSTS